MTPTGRIPCIVFAFHQIDLIRQTLHGLYRRADALSISVVENFSEHTAEAIAPFLREELAAGRIDRYVLFRENITGNAIETVLDAGLVPLGDAPYLLLTDGDVVADTPDWLDEQLGILARHDDVMICGVPLSEHNLPLRTFPEADKWVGPPVAVRDDYIETSQSGSHLWLIRTADLRAVLRFRRRTGRRSVDSTFGLYARRAGRRWALTRHAVATHLVWDLYADRDHPYTRMRLAKTFRQTWQHYRYCPCDIWTRDGHRVYRPLTQRLRAPYSIVRQGLRNSLGRFWQGLSRLRTGRPLA